MSRMRYVAPPYVYELSWDDHVYFANPLNVWCSQYSALKLFHYSSGWHNARWLHPICTREIKLAELPLDVVDLLTKILHILRQTADFIELPPLVSIRYLLFDKEQLLFKNNQGFPKRLFLCFQSGYNTATADLGCAVNFIVFDRCKRTGRFPVGWRTFRGASAVGCGMLKNLGERLEWKHMNLEEIGALLVDGLL